MEKSVGMEEGTRQHGSSLWSRRNLIKAAAVVAGVTALAPAAALARTDPSDGMAPDLADRASATNASDQAVGSPPTVISQPPRQWGPDAPPEIYPDPDIIVIDPSFNSVLLGITAIHRLWTGGKWLEGPAWFSEGNYLVFSDVQANIEYRYLWENGEVTKFRDPSYFANGHTTDFQGREVTCQDLFRRVIRWEPDGTMTVIADNFQGKPFNSPNGVVPHPDGSLWFTDPPYGDTLSEGQPDGPGGPANPTGLLNPRIGEPFGDNFKRQLPTNTYRWDPSGTLTVVVPESVVPDPNGLDFSPDHKTFYLISTGKGPGDTGPGGTGVIYAFDVQGTGVNTTVTNKRLFTDMVVDGIHLGPDDMRVDVFGNVYASAFGPLGYAGVLVFNAQGKLIGRIRLPEVAANVSFGGPRRNFLFITASQSLFVLQLQTQGAHPG